jgi:PPK2 family polyphosphate:nucleotide phosphotransferase
MKIDDASLKRFRVEPGTRVRLSEWPTEWMSEELAGLEKDELKNHAAAFIAERVREVGAAQELLWADNRYSVLLIFQGMDASGKDGTIKHITAGINPAGVRVVNFKAPSREELDRDYLWRYIVALPEQGQIGIFNRSYYEEVTVVRVNPDLLKARAMPERKVDARFWAERFEDSNFLEKHMRRNGTIVLKFFLHVSKKEQKKRFLERLQNPDKRWKFNMGDLVAREHWDAYQKAYEELLTATSTKEAPWWVIPADHKWIMRALVAQVVSREISRLNLRFPSVDEATVQQAIERLRRES